MYLKSTLYGFPTVKFTISLLYATADSAAYASLTILSPSSYVQGVRAFPLVRGAFVSAPLFAVFGFVIFYSVFILLIKRCFAPIKSEAPHCSEFTQSLAVPFIYGLLSSSRSWTENGADARLAEREQMSVLVVRDFADAMAETQQMRRYTSPITP